MEALKNLITNVPDWLKRLDELNGQIEQRQIELARLTEETKASSPDGRGSPGSCARSVRNKGSTESLKPRDEPEAHPRDPQPSSDTDNDAEKAAAAAAGAAAARASAAQPAAPSSPSDAQSPTALQVQTAGRARARATLRKRQRTDSIVSAEGATPKYRTRSMIIVYYDSYVQAFFEDLVKFVSASRNMMRKAKMAAKVARIKRLAELEMPDEEEEEKDKKPTPPPPPTTTTTTTPALAVDDAPIAAAGPKDTTAQEEEPLALPFVSTRRMGPGRAGMYTRAGSRRNPASAGMVGPDGKPVPGDVYDELDKGLDYVQSMCEHAAHQFLRDGDCGEEVANIKRRLGEVNELADKEMERVRREEPETLLKMAEEENGAGLRGRSYRPQSMRRDVTKPASPASPAAAAAAAAMAGAAPLEVDEGVQDVDGQEAAPQLMYKSARMMA
ncbi:uncharacterized protein B0T15DRAFT_182531 [Chaetomium strumarium]|uniref:Uncharacterized protein n=1 Tax=Chaetomium strumarium TaxID=1170767 RepID=A0AAJ0GWR8_9PEZI|nr:hypothetical protein B0T15DRAFT_182531 [Chaetomium strumarium]